LRKLLRHHKHCAIMRMSPLCLFVAAGSMCCLWFTSCAPNPRAEIEESYMAFTKSEEYPKTSKHWRDPELLEQTNPDNSRLVIDLEAQRGYLYNGEYVALDYPICSGRKSHPTPKGTYKVLEMKKEKSSNRYGRIYDAEGGLVNGDADILQDEIPEGGKFVGAPMPFWMRLSNDGVGHHVGPTKRYPASHGCIRGPSNVVPLVFERLKHGSEIVVD